VGLDPRIELMPEFVRRASRCTASSADTRSAIATFHRIVIDVVAPLVPAVKLQVACFEQYGAPGIDALNDTIADAKRRGLLVIGDAKRNDVASTAEAYARAFLWGGQGFDVDALTVSPFLGRDSLEPFVAACERYGKGLFVLVKTSNPGSADLQDQVLRDGRTISAVVAGLVDELGAAVIGRRGYSSIGAVVGATFPAEARTLRASMPKAIVLVPGYGAQGGTAADAVHNFNADGLGAVVNASRSITYAFGSAQIEEGEFRQSVRAATETMIRDLTASLATRAQQSGGV
jgi:orotidine-5'-phosphate decarboxylase